MLMLHLPQELMSAIYEYDGTYRDAFKSCIRDMQLLYDFLDRLFKCCFCGANDPYLWRMLRRISRTFRKQELKQCYEFMRRTSRNHKRRRLPKKITKLKMVHDMFFILYHDMPIVYQFVKIIILLDTDYQIMFNFL